jgi:hypothetical protein
MTFRYFYNPFNTAVFKKYLTAFKKFEKRFHGYFLPPYLKF